MTNRFLAMLALKEPARFSFEAVRDGILARAPHAPPKIDPLAQQGHPGIAPGTLLFTVDGVAVTVLFLDASVPSGELETALTRSTWPDARAAMAAHRAHLVVAALRTAENSDEALRAAVAITRVAAALSELTQAIGIYWATAQAVIEGRAFATMAANLDQRTLPVELWVRIDLFDGGLDLQKRQQLAMVTTGLQAFIGREIEFLPAAVAPMVMGQRLLGTIQYLIAQGLVVKDGDTLGVSERERIRIAFADQGQRPGIPILKLALEQLDSVLARE